MTAKSKKICIKQDSRHMESMTRNFNEALKTVEQAISEFETLTGQKLTPEDYPKFMAKPSEYTRQVLESQITVPAGFKKTEYLRMCEFPETAHLDGMLSDRVNVGGFPTCLTTPNFINFDGENVSLTEKAEKTINRNNVFVADSPKYRDLLKFLDLLNKMMEHDTDFKSEINLRYSDLFSYDSDQRKFEFKTDGLQRFLNPRR